MNSTIRILLSGAVALSLVAFTAASAVVAGLMSSATSLGLALLAVYGVIELALMTYAPARRVQRRALAGAQPERRSGAVVDFPAAPSRRAA